MTCTVSRLRPRNSPCNNSCCESGYTKPLIQERIATKNPSAKNSSGKPREFMLKVFWFGVSSF